MSLAECNAAATAEVNSTAVAICDPHLLDLCNDEHFRVIIQPDSGGHSWMPRSRNLQSRPPSTSSPTEH
ncbi:MAG: hypothetical protein QG597_1937 [Actinomycetota bacterium]|nr:hypothetical protein [Actinomycetota bacterium]